jgi:hypothetical protein
VLPFHLLQGRRITDHVMRLVIVQAQALQLYSLTPSPRYPRVGGRRLASGSARHRSSRALCLHNLM